MALFNWKDDYSVKVKEIDEQHQQLIALINKLHDAMGEKRGKEVVGEILKRLADYTVYHFANEERLLRSNGYPEYDAHHDKHVKMTGKVMALQEDLKSGKITLSIEVMNFLKNWLDKHILGTDKKYSSFLNEKGVS